MLFFKTSDKAIQIYYLSLSAVIITVTGWIFSTCNLPTPPQQIHQFFERILKSCKQVKFFKVLSWVLLKLGRLPPPNCSALLPHYSELVRSFIHVQQIFARSTNQ